MGLNEQMKMKSEDLEEKGQRVSKVSQEDVVDIKIDRQEWCSDDVFLYAKLGVKGSLKKRNRISEYCTDL